MQLSPCQPIYASTTAVKTMSANSSPAHDKIRSDCIEISRMIIMR
jgi:hypothetical protein